MEKAGEIFKTNNYDMFTFLDGNRAVSASRVKRVKESICEVGLMPAAPIIVNEQMQIIDGQCRYTVCKDLGIPIYFTIQNGAGIQECIAMNTSSTKWKLEDYVHSYVQQGRPSYKFLKEQMEKYASIPTSTLASICADVSHGGVIQGQVKSGNFQLDEDAMREAELSLAWIAPMIDKAKSISGRSDLMLCALNWVYRHSSASKSRIEAVFGQMVFEANANNVAIGNIKHALQLLENAYNRNIRKQNRIRLVVEYEEYQSGNYSWYEKKWGGLQADKKDGEVKSA